MITMSDYQNYCWWSHFETDLQIIFICRNKNKFKKKLIYWLHCVLTTTFLSADKLTGQGLSSGLARGLR